MYPWAKKKGFVGRGMDHINVGTYNIINYNTLIY